MKVVNKKRDMNIMIDHKNVKIPMGIEFEVSDKDYQFLYSVYREVERVKVETPKAKTTPPAKMNEVKDETPKAKKAK